MSVFNKASELAENIGREEIIKRIKHECERLKTTGDNNARVAALVLDAVGIIESGKAEDSARSLVDMDLSQQAADKRLTDTFDDMIERSLVDMDLSQQREES